MFDKEIKYLKLEAKVRYLEDAYLNNEEDINGKMPCLIEDNMWIPIIDIETGRIINWIENNEAEIHYKVCDEGEYFLLNKEKEKIYKYDGYYVPEKVVCNGKGYGDYIIMKINKQGYIKNFKPIIEEKNWIKIENE